MNFPLNKIIRTAPSPWLFIILIALWLSGIAYAAESQSPSPEGILFRDDFRQPPAAPWTWIRENPKSLRFGHDGLEIQLEPGGLMGAGKDAKNILVRPLPIAAQSASVRVSADLKEQYEQAGLILYIDDDNYIKLVNEFVDGKTWVVLVVEIKAAARVVNKWPQSETPVWVGLNLNHEKVMAFCWGAETKPVEIGRDSFPMESRPRIGVFTQSGRPNLSHWAKFTDFVVSAKAITR